MAEDLNDIHVREGVGGVRRFLDGARKFNGIGADRASSQTQEPQPRPIRFLHEIAFDGTCNYVVKGLLGGGDLSVVFGESGIDKTFFYLDIGFHVALGCDWRGHRVKQGGVLIIGLEGRAGLEKRLIAFRKRFEVGDRRIPLATWEEGVDFCTRGDGDAKRIVAEIKSAFGQTPPSFIIIDTLARAISGDENKEGMAAFIRGCGILQRQTGAHVMAIHHVGKDASKGERGHSSLGPAADTRIEVQRPSGSKISVGTVRKQKDGEEGKQYQFELIPVTVGIDKEGDEAISCYVEHIDGDPINVGRTKITRTKNQRVFDEAFNELIISGKSRKHRPLDDAPEVQAVTSDYLKAEFKRRFVTGAENEEKARHAAKTAWLRFFPLDPPYHGENKNDVELIWKAT